MQIDSEKNAEEYVFDCFDTMYSAFERDRAELNEDRLHEIRYEELVKDPVSSMEKAYEKLKLGGFEKVRPAFEKQAESMKGYSTNTYQHDPRIISEIAKRWQPFIQRYGYKQPTVD